MLAGALRAAGHQQRRAVGVEAEELPGLGPQRGPVELADHPADRQPDVRRLRQLRVREADRDHVGDPGTGLVGQAGQGVLLVHDERQLAAAGGEVGRHRDVAAVADHHVRADPVEDRHRLLDRAPQPAGDPQQVGVGAPRHRHRRDQLQRVAGLGHHAVLQAPGRAEAGDLHGRVEAPQGVGGREQGRGVASGATTGKKDAHGFSVLDGRCRPDRRTGACAARRAPGRPRARTGRSPRARRGRPARAAARSRRTTPAAAGCR